MVSFVHPCRPIDALVPTPVRGAGVRSCTAPIERGAACRTALINSVTLLVLLIVLSWGVLPRLAAAQAQPQAQAQATQGAATPLLTPQFQQQVQALTAGQIAAPAHARIEVSAGSLDPRLKLAPCNRIEPYLPAGARLWGATRVGLRCTDGPVHWNVYLPVTVKVWAPALVAAAPIAAGTELTGRELMLTEVDIAASPGATFEQASALIGRKLATPLAPGAPVRADMLRLRQWFAAGEPVVLVARGDGFSVSGSGEALGPGLDGQQVRVRTEGGRIVVGLPVGERRVEIRL
jgi:flagella basal body P-ring formation protein FlgA